MFLCALCLFTGQAVQAQICTDDACGLDGSAPARADDEPLYAVVSPVGTPSVEPIAQVPRLETLAGKTIAVVGGSFMASVMAGCPLEFMPLLVAFTEAMGDPDFRRSWAAPTAGHPIAGSTDP